MSAFAKEKLGAWPIYPGHPLTIALVIMHRYEDFARAAELRASGYEEALTNPDIPGAGSEVNAALWLLQNLQAGSLTIEEAPAEAARRWVTNQAGGHLNKIAAGQRQADELAARFVEKAQDWFQATNAIPA